MVSAAPRPVEPIEITSPGVYPNLPDAVYLADPVPGGSLSHSGAKTLLPPGCPALFDHQRRYGRPDKRVFDFGRAAHRIILGAGADIAAVDADDWRTVDAKRRRDEIRAKGLTPLLRHEMTMVEEMAEALADNPLAVELLQRPGVSEAALFAEDERDGVMLRAKLDRLPDADGRRLLLVDYKSAPTADPDSFARSVWNYRYFMQAPFYMDIVQALGIADDLAFLFIVQSKEPPYLSTVCGLDDDAVRFGRRRNREAIALYAACRARDEWPGYSDDVTYISLPPWAARDMENR